MNKQKIIIVLTVLINAVGMGVVFPILPFYVERFNTSPLLVTMLFAVFAFFSFVSSPFIGLLSDKVGRRPALIISIISTAFGWVVFALAQNIWMLFVGRIIDGMAAGNIPVAQSYLVDIAKGEKERTKNLGLLGAMMGVGFIVGPAIGGFLGAIDPVLPFWVVGIVSALNAVGAYYFLPETNQVENKKSVRDLPLNPFLPLVAASKDKTLRRRYAAWLLFAIAVSVSQTIFTLYLNAVFGFTEAVAGTMFTFMGFVMIFNQLFGLKHFWLKYFKPAQLETWLFPFFALGFVLMVVKSLTFFMIGLLLMTFGQSVLRVVMSSTVVGVTGANRRGEVMGVMTSLMSLGMVLGPLVAGPLFQKSHAAPFWVAAVLDILAFLVMLGCFGQVIRLKKLSFRRVVEVEAEQRFP